MADPFNLVNQLSILLAGRRPEWIRQFDAAYPNPLPDDSSGVALRDAPRTQIMVDMREEIRHRTARVAIRVLDLTATYRATIGGANVDYVAADATVTEVLEGWRDAINVAPPPVTATLEDFDGTPVLKIVGDTDVDYSFAVSVPAGTAELDAAADPVSADFAVYLHDKPPKAQPIAVPNAAATGFPAALLGSGDWRRPNGAVYAAGVDGFADFFDTAGYDRVYVRLTTVAGVGGDGAAGSDTFTLTPRITVGPSISEV